MMPEPQPAPLTPEDAPQQAPQRTTCRVCKQPLRDVDLYYGWTICLDCDFAGLKEGEEG